VGGGAINAAGTLGMNCKLGAVVGAGVTNDEVTDTLHRLGAAIGAGATEAIVCTRRRLGGPVGAGASGAGGAGGAGGTPCTCAGTAAVHGAWTNAGPLSVGAAAVGGGIRGTGAEADGAGVGAGGSTHVGTQPERLSAEDRLQQRDHPELC